MRIPLRPRCAQPITTLPYEQESEGFVGIIPGSTELCTHKRDVFCMLMGAKFGTTGFCTHEQASAVMLMGIKFGTTEIDAHGRLFLRQHYHRDFGTTVLHMIETMRLLGNILWLILGGLVLACGWALTGIVLCITIIGIPLGVQSFKMATLTLTPFGKTVEYGGSVGSLLVNVLWVVLVGWWMALGYLLAGVLNCITIIGIPFGLQSFKMAKLALWPFGSQIRDL